MNLFGKPPIHKKFENDASIVLHCGDSFGFLKTLPDNLASLIITSPPYNLGKAYEIRTSIQNYLVSQSRVIDELIRILSSNGSICWQVGNYVQASEVFPLDIFYYEIFKKKGLRLRNRIVWHFGHGLHATKRFSGRYETILWFTKADKYIFNLDDVRTPSKYPGKTHFKGPKRGKPSGNPLGKNPSDFWEYVARDWEEQVWDIPNVKSNHPEKTIHPCQFPIELVERCVVALTKKDDYVLDPYCGVGSALIAAIKNQRKAIGVDKEEAYVQIANERINAFLDGKLKVRKIGTPIYEPSGREKVSQIPLEWRKSP
jgi:DNA modification methylase